MQLLLIFHKTNCEYENLKALVDLAVFQQLSKLRKEEGLSSFYSDHFF